ncbi:hypothetical protein ACLIA0_07645 [Bacillaceae bacterium W0354]
MERKIKFENYFSFLILFLFLFAPLVISIHHVYIYYAIVVIVAVVEINQIIHREHYDLKFYHKWKIRREKHYFYHFFRNFIGFFTSFIIGILIVPYIMSGEFDNEWKFFFSEYIGTTIFIVIMIIIFSAMGTSIQYERNESKFNKIEYKLMQTQPELLEDSPFS